MAAAGVAQVQQAPTYAGIGARFVAALVDGLIVAVGGVLAVVVMGPLFGKLVYMALGLAYGALLESSEKQATFGKQMMGIKVTDVEGRRIDVTKAFIRQVGKFVSGAILCIGYIIAFFTAKKQALHDLLAGTLVVK